MFLDLPKKIKVLIANVVLIAKYNANVCYVALKVIFVQIKIYIEVNLVIFCEKKSGFFFTKEDAQDTDMTFHLYITLD